MWKFRVYRWHSINLIPHFTFYSICSDEANYPTIALALDLMLLGFIIRIMVPSRKTRKFYSSPMIGWLWSRGRKRWYKFREITKEHWDE